MLEGLRPWRIAARTRLNVAAGAVVNVQPKVIVGGHRRVVGFIRLRNGTAPAAGFPRLRWSLPGDNTWDMVDVLPQDLSQLPQVVFPFDVTIRAPYLAIELTNGGAQTDVIALAWLMPL